MSNDDLYEEIWQAIASPGKYNRHLWMDSADIEEITVDVLLTLKKRAQENE